MRCHTLNEPRMRTIISPGQPWTAVSALLGLISMAKPILISRRVFANPFKRQFHIANVVTGVGNSTAVLPRHSYGEEDPLCRMVVRMRTVTATPQGGCNV